MGSLHDENGVPSGSEKPIGNMGSAGAAASTKSYIINLGFNPILAVKGHGTVLCLTNFELGGESFHHLRSTWIANVP